jgi:hypothetical protein
MTLVTIKKIFGLNGSGSGSILFYFTVPVLFFWNRRALACGTNQNQTSSSVSTSEFIGNPIIHCSTCSRKQKTGKKSKTKGEIRNTILVQLLCYLKLYIRNCIVQSGKHVRRQNFFSFNCFCTTIRSASWATPLQDLVCL